MSKNRNNYSGYFKSPTREVNDELKKNIEEVQPIEEATKETRESDEKIPEPKKAKVTGAKLVNMRAVASKDGMIIDKLPEGTIVEVGESKLLANSGWTHIKYNEKTGFMMTKFLKEI